MKEESIQRETPVLSYDGHRLGEVGETRPEHIEVVADGDTFWLERSVLQVDVDHVVVGFMAKELDQYRTSDPGAQNVVPATSRHGAYIKGATQAEANDLADPEVEPSVEEAAEEVRRRA